MASVGNIAATGGQMVTWLCTFRVQGYLTRKKPPHLRTLQQAHV